MAAASLGRLTLDLVAKIGNFIEPMTKAERQAQKSGKGIADSFNVAALAATAFGAAVAGMSIGGLVAFADQTIQTGSEIKKFSQLANTSVRDFQYYAKGAETAGISMESFADKMKDMQDRIGDFQQTGGGPLADFFTNIAPLVGVTIQQFQKLSGPQALQLYYDSLKKVGATQNDMKFYMEAIISDSSLLLPLLENGGAGFKKWGDAAERANAILSDDMVQSLALAKENVQLLNLQWEGLQATFVNAVVPVVQTVSDNMGNIKAVVVAVAAAMAVKLVPTIAVASYQLAQLTAFSVRAGIGLVGLSGSMGALSGAMAFLGGPAGLAMLALQGLAAGAAFLYMKKSSDSLDPSLSTQGKSIADLTAEYEKLDATQKRVLTRKATDELNEANKVYREQKNELLGLIDAVTRNSQVSEKERGVAAQLFEQYRQGKISSNDLATAVNSLATVSDAAKSSIDRKAEAVGKESDTVNNAQTILNAYNGKVKENTKTNRENARSISEQASALSTLTQKQREALKDIQDQVAKANYIDVNMAAGWSREKAEYFADYRQNAGLSFTGASLSELEKKQVEAGFKLEQQTKAREESEKKIEELNRKKLELTQKQYSYTKAELQMLQKVAELNAKHNLNEIGAKYGVPDNLLAAVMAQESKGNINAKSPTGAIGPFQTTSIFRKQYGLSVDDSYNVPKVADAIARDISKSFEVFGNWYDAITAVNAGAQGTKNLLAKGFTGSAAKTKEAKGYAPLVDKWLTGLAGTGEKGSSILSGEKTDAVKAWGDYWAEIEAIKAESLERQKSVTQTYFTAEEQMAEDNKEKLRLINEAFAGDKTAIEKYTKLQQLAYQQDVENYRRAQKEKFDASKNDLLGQLANAEDAISLFGIASKYGKNSLQYQNASLGITSKQAKAAEFDRYTNSVNQIGNEYGAPDEVEKRYELIELAKKLHLENMKMMDAEYLASAKQMSLDQYQQQLDMWQGLLANGQNTFSQLTQAVQSSAGEQSTAYQIMFAGQQAFSVASSLMAAWTAYTQAFADPSAMTLPQKFAGGMAVMAALAPALATISSIAIEGFADGGFTGYGGKYDVAGLVHRGEGVLTQEEIAALGGPAGFFALRQSIKNGFADGGLALDAPKVLNMQSPKMSGYMQQAQQSSQANVNLNPNFVIVDERESLSDYLYSPDGKKAFVKFFKRNRAALGV